MAKTFKFGENGKWATKTGSSLAYNDQNDNFKPMPFSVIRDSIATRVNKQGLIEVVGNDKLRIDYTDSTKGVALLEPARTNYLKNNQNLQGSGWANNGGITLEFNQDDPFGGSNAVKMTDFNDSADRYDANTSKAGVSGETVTYSGYYKGSGSINIAINTSTGLGGSFEKTIDLTDEWVRHEIKHTFTSAVTGTYRAHTAITRTANNDAVVYLSYPQIEVGSYATSIIITGNSQAERAADVANGAGNSEVFNDSEGVLYSNFAVLKGDTSVVQFSISDKTNNETVKFLQLNSTAIRAEVIMSSGSNFVYDITINPQNFNKFALNYKANEYKVFANGFSYSITQRATTPSGLNSFQFDRGDGGSDFYGKTKEIGVYDAVLTDAELEALTSYTSFTNMANELNLTIK